MTEGSQEVLRCDRGGCLPSAAVLRVEKRSGLQAVGVTSTYNVRIGAQRDS